MKVAACKDCNFNCSSIWNHANPCNSYIFKLSISIKKINTTKIINYHCYVYRYSPKWAVSTTECAAYIIIASIRTVCIQAQCVHLHSILCGWAGADYIARNRVTKFLKLSETMLLCYWLLLIGWVQFGCVPMVMLY